ncbi:MAG: hypothetical protein K2X91_04165 [Thermoleophilia bacterium]|nr:hypothetical protein [Thermoleophilia bacterium]
MNAKIHSLRRPSPAERYANETLNLVGRHVSGLMEKRPREIEGATGITLAAAMSAVIRLMAMNRRKDTPVPNHRALIMASVTHSLDQWAPVEVTDNPAAPGVGFIGMGEREIYLRGAAGSACSAVQELATALHESEPDSTIDPADGIVSGLLAGVVYAAASLRDRALYPRPHDLEPVLLELMRSTFIAAEIGEGGDAMGEVQGNG